MSHYAAKKLRTMTEVSLELDGSHNEAMEWGKQAD